MDHVRLGIVGAGSIAKMHSGYFDDTPGLKFAAITDVSQEALKHFTDNFDDVKTFSDAIEMFDSGEIDAVMICTPHFSHPTLSIEALKRGLHVLVEKPVAVTAHDAQEMNEAYEAMKKKPIFSAMLNCRTQGIWKEAKRLVESGEIGEIRRTNWVITTWFRSQTYYDSGTWRATWKGEGGGVLLNQCPHQLDLFQWICGMPNRVTANIGLGKYHHIEVEDDVTAVLEYPNGATGVFVTTTGEAPGINRLEIVGDKGTLIIDGKDEDIKMYRTQIPVSEHIKTSTTGFGAPPADEITIKPADTGKMHQNITKNFINAILHDEALIAPATEGIHSLELGNAMLMSGLQGQPIEVPTPRKQFAELIKKLGDESTFQKNEVKQANNDLSKSLA